MLTAAIGGGTASVGLEVDAALANWRHEAQVFGSGAGLLIIVIWGLVFLGLRYMRSHELLARARTEKEILKEREAAATKLEEQKLQLDTALNNMQQGLLMFDAEGRLVLWNQRFLEMYGLSGEAVKLGCKLSDLLRLRMAVGTFRGDPDQYMAKLVGADGRFKGDPDRQFAKLLEEGRVETKEFELPDGRIISITNQSTPVHGWVSVHEDITERRRNETELAAAQVEAERAEQHAHAAHARLLDAIEIIPEGFALFDAEGRYILWNRRYAELYVSQGIDLVVGLRFEDLLRAGLARKLYPEARGREEEWLAQRLALHAQPQSGHEQQLTGDRWVRIEERRTADGGSVGIRIDITELKRREASFRLLFESNPVPMWVYDHETLQFLAVNDAAVEHYGYTREQFLDMTLLDIRPIEDQEEVCRLARSHEGDYRSGRTWRHIKRDFTQIDVAVYSRLLEYEGRAASLAAVIDLTDRKRAEDELRRTHAFLDAIVENVPVTIVVKDARDFRYTLINRAGEEYFGCARSEMLGKTASELFPKPTADLVIEHDEAAREAGKPLFYNEHAVDTLGHGARIVTTTRLAIPDENGTPQYLLGVINDVTERKRAEDRIAYMAYHDALTDLPNRAAFNETLSAAIERAQAEKQSFAVLSLDFDRFKEINDLFGHPAGDAVLRDIAERLRAAAEGAFVARIGGDEFMAITVLGPQPATAAALAERMQTILGQAADSAAHPLPLGISIGVAIFPADATEPETLISNADAALYRSKGDGGGAIRFFEAEMDRDLREQRALQHDLKAVLERGDLALHYQPQARLDGSIVGFEALLRWRHPTRGMMPPLTFIPLAEESGMIIAIGEWVMREACRVAASWPQPLQIAVNLSPSQFRHGDLPGLVHSILLETGLAPHRLELEITESMLIGDFSRAAAILRRLKSLGLRIAMDDFGTGYSSLSYLQSFPFDKIKVDQSFISNLDQNHQSATIVRAVINLGRQLGIPVLAEGVETEEQLAFLRREGCNEVQGYLLGRPSPISEYQELLGLATSVTDNGRPRPRHQPREKRAKIRG